MTNKEHRARKRLKHKVEQRKKWIKRVLLLGLIIAIVLMMSGCTEKTPSRVDCYVNGQNGWQKYEDVTDVNILKNGWRFIYDSEKYIGTSEIICYEYEVE